MPFRASLALTALAVLASCGGDRPVRLVYEGAPEPETSAPASDAAPASPECRPCTADSDCGNGAHCFAVTGEPATCVVACATDGACAAGFTCGTVRDATGAERRDCLPDSTCASPGATPACTPDTWTSFAGPLIASSCTSCHAAYGAPSAVRADATKIRDAVASKRMPQGGALAAPDLDRLLKWLDCGQP